RACRASCHIAYPDPLVGAISRPMLSGIRCVRSSSFFFFNDPATTEIYTLSLHDALPIFLKEVVDDVCRGIVPAERFVEWKHRARSEEHTSELQSHLISYAVFCLKKKKKIQKRIHERWIQHDEDQYRHNHTNTDNV